MREAEDPAAGFHVIKVSRSSRHILFGGNGEWKRKPPLNRHTP
jgi:hypothetical protein